MSDILLYIECEDYLRQWIVYEHGGNNPVRLKKGSPEAIFLEIFLQNKPASSSVSHDRHRMLQVIIPEFRHKSPLYYNYLSPKATTSLLKIFRRRFDFAIWNDLLKIPGSYARKDELIQAWCEAHGIEDTEKNILAVTQRLRRLNDRINARSRMRRIRGK